MFHVQKRLALFTFFLSHLFLSGAFPEATLNSTVSPAKDGAKISVNFNHGSVLTGGTPVTVVLFTEVTDSKGDTHLIHIAELDHEHKHTSTNTKREYTINYDQINKNLARQAPNANLMIGPGTKMFVMGRWILQSSASHDPYNGSTLGTQHYYGGTGKAGGRITLPTPSNGWTGGSGNTGSGRNSKNKLYLGGTATDLDVGNTAGPDITGPFPEMKGVEIGSRYERELKLHVELSDLKRLEKALDSWVADPAKVQSLFGPGSSMAKDNRFVGKPMVDRYLDLPDFTGASNGTAVRFRTGGGITNMNIKPNDGDYQGDQMFDRVEYYAKASKAKSVERFADSNHPANFFALLADIAPKGTNPSDFFRPAVKITDKRQKYKLKLAGGEEVEFSLDHLKGQQMNGSRLTGPIVEAAQLEVEVDHMGAQGSTNIGNNSGSQQWRDQFSTKHGAALTTFLKGLQPGSSIGGTAAAYTLHGKADFKSNSPIHRVNKATFTNTNKVFHTIVKALFPQGAGASGQKYAVVAAALGLVDYKDWAPSVQIMVKEQLGVSRLTKAKAETCFQAMVKVK